MADVVLVHTKAYDTVVAIEGARPVIGDETVLISFQNGLGNEETIAGIVGEQKVLGGPVNNCGLKVGRFVRD